MDNYYMCSILQNSPLVGENESGIIPDWSIKKKKIVIILFID